MKAMILASGTGSRLSPLTKKAPKCLIDLNGKTVLGLQLEHIQNAGISEVIITTGPFREKIEDFGKKQFPSLHITCVFNERFDSTNYIYSMYKCKDLIDDSFLLMHGDLVFDRELLTGILMQPASAVLMNRSVPLPEKDFKGLLRNNTVVKIGVDVFAENAFFLAPLYKLTCEAFQQWMKKIVEFVDAGKVTCYAENAFNEISDSIPLKPYFYSDNFCMELDTFDDLEIIRGSLSSHQI